MRRRWPLAVPVLALLAVLGGLLLGAAPTAHACSVVAWRTERVPVDQATDEDRRWAIPSLSGPDYLELPQPRPLPPGGVLFEGTAVATGTRPPRHADWGPAPTWTFRVEQVLRGDLAPEVVVVGGNPGSPCGHLGPRYPVGVRQQVGAVPDPATGEWLGIPGRYAALPPEPAPVRPTPAPTTVAPPAPPTPVPAQPPATPAPTLAPVAPAGPTVSSGAYATQIALVFLAEVGVLGVVLTGAAVYLRARELDLEARELALREREAGRRS
jgi:hypothetical protein